MADLDQLLKETSRTFALAIPLLPEPYRREVTIAYLLFRIADTFEDATHWAREERIVALERFVELLRARDRAGLAAATKSWLERSPSDHAGYLELLAETPAVFDALEAVRPEARIAIVHHTARTALGMADVVRRADERGSLALDDLEDLRSYCYLVAGIVGELLTDLFVIPPSPAARVSRILREHDVAFGEGLQLVNILKDADDDAKEGRTYLPAGVSRAEVLDLARADLERARLYVLALQASKAEPGVVAFTALPVLLARATLDKLEVEGPGAKIPRAQVVELLFGLQGALSRGEDAIPLEN